MTPQPALQDIVPRLQAARDHVDSCREATALALKQRDELVVEAIDNGVPHRTAASAAGVALSRVAGILAEQSSAMETAVHRVIGDDR